MICANDTLGMDRWVDSEMVKDLKTVYVESKKKIVYMLFTQTILFFFQYIQLLCREIVWNIKARLAAAHTYESHIESPCEEFL